MTNTMRKCGGCCLSANAVKIAKKLYAKSNNLTEFLNLLNEADIGGKNLHISGDKIIAVYKKCYCNIPKKVENLNKNYCECSAGWYMRLFSEVFEKKVVCVLAKNNESINDFPPLKKAFEEWRRKTGFQY